MRYTVSIQLPEELREALVSSVAEVREQATHVSWLAAEDLFLNVKFLGGYHKRKAKVVKKALLEAASLSAPFEVKISGFGCFPETGSPRVVWVGVQDKSLLLRSFVRECESSFLSIGIEAASEAFVPHIVLGRATGKLPKGSGRLRKDVARLSFDPVTLDVKEAVLVESRLSKEGPSYRVLEAVPLSAAIAR